MSICDSVVTRMINTYDLESISFTSEQLERIIRKICKEEIEKYMKVYKVR